MALKTAQTVVALVAFAWTPLHGQSLCGVWKPVEVVIDRGPEAGRHTTDVQPGLFIFSQTHYSGMQVRGFQPRPQLGDTPTDEERGRAFTPFTANAGTYVLEDSLLTMTPVVSKNPSQMTGGAVTDRVRVVADTLWFISASGERRNKWVRIERTCVQ